MALSSRMTVREFETGYWYAGELKDFARRLGIPGAPRLRKDELERAILGFLRTGKKASPTKRALRKTGVKDLERGLRLDRRIEHYTSNRQTKGFIIAQARKIAPDAREKSGIWYRLNRWREEQLVQRGELTYGDLVRQFIALSRVERFEKIPSGRYINFLAEFHAAQPAATRAAALAAWAELKGLGGAKNYASWAKARTPARPRRTARARRVRGSR
jgi:SAP domain-containing new25